MECLAQYFRNYFLSEKKKNELLNKVDVNYCVPDTLPDKKRIREWAGYTILHFVAKKNDLDMANELLKKGADPTKQSTKEKCTPLHIAMSKNYEYVYKKTGRLQKDSLINVLLSKQVETNNTFNPKCNNGITHLHIACMVNHTKAVEFFVKAKVDFYQQINIDAQYYLSGYTPLHCAIEYSSVEAANVLLQHGAEIHIKCAKGMSCLHLLLQRLIDITDMIRMGKRRLCTPYLEETERLESIVKSVLKIGLNREIFLDQTGLSALHVACTLKDKSFVEDLLKLGVDVNMPVKSESEFWLGWAPLHFAACFSIETMVLLMQNGANIMMKNSEGKTALDLCTKRFNPTDIQMLLSMEIELKDIVLLDNSTKLSDLLLAMSNCEKFSEFLQKLKDIKVVIPFDSPIWPGYNLLHLSVSLNEKSQLWEDFEKEFDFPEIPCVLERYNCTEDEEASFDRRIELCIKNGCSVDMKNAHGQTPIHLAFHMHSKEAIEKLLCRSEENLSDQDNLFHLHIACTLGLKDSVEKYLSNGADVDCRTKINFDWPDKQYKIFSRESNVVKTIRAHSTPLHIAVVFAHKDIVEYLLKNNADVYAQDSLGFTSIHLTSYIRYFEMTRSIFRLLFHATPNVQDRVSAIGLSHLHVAAYMDEGAAIVNDLILNGAEIEQVIDSNVERCPYISDWAGKTPLLVAMSVGTEGSKKGVSSLLNGGANVYAKDLQGVSALQHAMEDLDRLSTQPFIDIIKNGRCQVDSCGMTPLHVACGYCDVEWATQLIEDGADVNARISKGDLTGATPMGRFMEQILQGFTNRSIEREGIDLVRLLVESGADVTIDCDGDTPLHRICVYYSDGVYDELEDELTHILPIANLLLMSLNSYDVNSKDRYGFTHFHLACLCNDVGIARKFLDYGVDVNMSSDPLATYNRNGGLTPLHFAMAHKSTEVVYLLLERGADVNAEDVYGNKPLHTGLQEKFVNLPLIKTMLRLGADALAKNCNGETLLNCLMGYGGLTLESFDFFLDYGCSINILNARNGYGFGIIGLVVQTAPPIELQSILKRLAQLSEMKSAIQKGYSAIHSIVDVGTNIANHRITIDSYLSAIELFINIESDLDELDSKGRTALHIAVYFDNGAAINALLALGADVNATNNKDECPFLETEIMTTYTWRMDAIKALATHVWKMRFVGLYIKDSNVRCLQRAETQFPLVATLEQSCQHELRKARETEICLGLTVNDFLSEVGAIAQYPRMCLLQKAIVEKFFKRTSDLRREFPELSGLLIWQYKKALRRIKLREATKEAIVLICEAELPDPCLEAIMRFLANYEMELLVENTKHLI